MKGKGNHGDPAFSGHSTKPQKRRKRHSKGRIQRRSLPARTGRTPARIQPQRRHPPPRPCLFPRLARATRNARAILASRRIIRKTQRRLRKPRIPGSAPPRAYLRTKSCACPGVDGFNHRTIRTESRRPFHSLPDTIPPQNIRKKRPGKSTFSFADSRPERSWRKAADILPQSARNN